jgi:hypothetical protein
VVKLIWSASVHWTSYCQLTPLCLHSIRKINDPFRASGVSQELHSTGSCSNPFPSNVLATQICPFTIESSGPRSVSCVLTGIGVNPKSKGERYIRCSLSDEVRRAQKQQVTIGLDPPMEFISWGILGGISVWTGTFEKMQGR